METIAPLRKKKRHDTTQWQKSESWLQEYTLVRVTDTLLCIRFFESEQAGLLGTQRSLICVGEMVQIDKEMSDR